MDRGLPVVLGWPGYRVHNLNKALLQAPVILSQSDLQDKVSEVLEAVKKDQEATGSVQAVPKIVLVSRKSDSPSFVD